MNKHEYIVKVSYDIAVNWALLIQKNMGLCLLNLCSSLPQNLYGDKDIAVKKHCNHKQLLDCSLTSQPVFFL